ncbi:hypothetical protein [Loigolactobacillus bifermentans]|uniref:Uncharacterized protein n=1 Tax=Loigolactobacillus bifermentans DSM 20003 TaxID=1423726 RepID=A0A0R1H348_9LACO|nr:hypothetical protein [Loigolactobacillus bifermentans]KRK40821.1 hypothetical protein FC07_GL002571 [Loigolactobacillus bifermentans DSM 20003]QGG59575.1 hypothetical protein LB003_03250 [Loigolactobacillus bifermentans]
MKFEEVFKLLKEQSDRGADTWYGPQLDKFTRTRGHLEHGSVEMVLHQLQKEYAPEELEK